jgi:hypothetical protein
MRFEFLKIDEGEAYMLDTQRGVVVVAPIERVRIGISEPMKPTPIVPMVERYVPDWNGGPTAHTASVLAPAHGEGLSDTQALIKEAMDAPRQVNRAQSVIPSAMRGLFIEHGQKGAATETRRV